MVAIRVRPGAESHLTFVFAERSLDEIQISAIYRSVPIYIRG